jgi:fatty-acyl-CoA synthase
MLATSAGSSRGITTGEPGQPMRRTWPQVHEQALRIAGALIGGGLRAGDAVAVLAGDPALVAPAVQAAWLAGGSVTMLHQPTPRTDLGVWAQDTVAVLRMIDSRLVLLGAEFEPLSELLDQHGIPFRALSALARSAGSLAEPVPVDDDATALLQLTSGSTAVPKAVRITHGNLHANLSAMARTARLHADTDVMVSWLPLFHDMGMVGFLTLPMALGLELVKTTPVAFLRAPLLWPDLITRYGGTVTAAPNFAYAMAARRLSSAADTAYDLSCLRLALNGAEPIDPGVTRAFIAAGARFGMPAGSLVCAYGMAEVTLAVSFASPGDGLLVDDVDAAALESDRLATPSSGAGRRSFPLLGPPLPGLQVRAVDGSGAPRGVREVGVLQVRGESVTPGYLTVDGPRPTRDANGWLNTGDEGYLVEDGQVVVCGRVKDVIIMGGRNIYPTDIERAASTVDGVRAGNVVAVRLDAGHRRESFAVAVESRLAGDPDTERGIRNQVVARVVDAVGVRPLKVVVLPPGSIPKTPSGKLRRTATRPLIEP